MTTGEMLHILIKTQNYASIRYAMGDSFIDFIRENLPSDYELIREKEEKYQAEAQINHKSDLLCVIKSVCPRCGQTESFRTNGNKIQCASCGRWWRQKQINNQ